MMMSSFFRFFLKQTGPRREALKEISRQIDKAIMENNNSQMRRVIAVNTLLNEVVTEIERKKVDEANQASVS